MILKGFKLGPTCFTISMTHLYYYLIYAKYFRNNFEKAVNIYPFINSKYKNEILSGAKTNSNILRISDKSILSMC